MQATDTIRRPRHRADTGTLPTVAVTLPPTAPIRRATGPLPRPDRRIAPPPPPAITWVDRTGPRHTQPTRRPRVAPRLAAVAGATAAAAAAILTALS